MPNWCENLLDVSGTPHLVRQFMDDADRASEGSNVFSLSAFHPCPPSLSDAEESSNASIGYTVFCEEQQWANQDGSDISDAVAILLEYPHVQEAGVTTLEGLRQYYRDKSPAFEIQGKLRKHNREKHGYTSWYDWCVANWGTKWDIDCENSEISTPDVDTLMAVYSFESAWGPPISAICHVSSLFTGLSFTLRYAEPGCGFEGLAEFKDGHEIEEIQQAYTGTFLIRDEF
jgi:hypothetical protein